LTPEVRRKMVKPNLRWLENIESDLRELKVKRWRHKAKEKSGHV
jgi:hypothetical protein